MAKSALQRSLGPGTPLYRFAIWLNENPRKWLTWVAIGAAALAVAVIAFAAVWAAVLPEWRNVTPVWAWGVVAAIFFVICTGLLLINASGRMPGWLAAVLAVGGLFTSMGVLMVFFWAVLATDTNSLIVVAAILISLVVVIPLTFALMWPLAQSMRPWIDRQPDQAPPPGGARSDS